MTLEEKVHGLRLHVMRRVQALGNVSQACREARDIPRAVLPVAAPGGALWGGQPASARPARPPRPTSGIGSGNRAPAPERGRERRHLGRGPDCHLRGAALGRVTRMASTV